MAMISHRMNSAHSQIDVVIFTSAKRYVEPPGVQQTPAIVHHGPMHADLVVAQKCIVGVRSDIPADRIARHAAASVNKVKTAIDETGLRVANEALETGFDRALAKPVVSVEKDDLVTYRGFQSGVARRGKPLVSLTDQPDTTTSGWSVEPSSTTIISSAGTD